MTTYVYTSIALNYLPKARVLSTTLKKFHPEWRFCLLLADKITDEQFKQIKSYGDIDEIICYSELVFTNGFGQKLSEIEFKQWAFKHNIVEFCTAIKGSGLLHILQKRDCTNVMYFDPDIAIFDRLDDLMNNFNNNSILLTPHLTEIESSMTAVWDNEISVLKHGIYNLGFLGVKNDILGNRFANWWKDRLDMYCYNDIPNGVFTDQSWCDIVPAVFENVSILRSPRYNVATWNLTHRYIDGSDINNLYVNKEYKLGFYHFSGFDSGAQLAMLKCYGKEMPKLFELRDWYIKQCVDFFDQNFSSVKWQLSKYEDCSRIADSDRVFFRNNCHIFAQDYDPFSKKIFYCYWLKFNKLVRKMLSVFKI